MPTVEEQLEDLLINTTKAFTHKCWTCHGLKVVPDYNSEAEEIQLNDGRIATAYAQKPCHECGEEGIVIPKPHEHAVSNMVVCGAVGMLLRARASEDFDTLNRVLDWVVRFIAMQVETSPISIEESVAAFTRLIEDSPLNNPEPAKISLQENGALSQEELDELLGEKTEN